jgi:hypothetical protein
MCNLSPAVWALGAVSRDMTLVCRTAVEGLAARTSKGSRGRLHAARLLLLFWLHAEILALAAWGLYTNTTVKRRQRGS